MLNNYKIIIILIFLFSLIINCESITRNEEILRITSPDKKVDAIIIRTNGGGATLPVYYYIYILPFGKEIKNNNKEKPILVADKFNNFKMEWDKRILIITYEKARIFKFTNYWISKEVDYFNYKVEIRLNPIGEFSF